MSSQRWSANYLSVNKPHSVEVVEAWRIGTKKYPDRSCGRCGLDSVWRFRPPGMTKGDQRHLCGLNLSIFLTYQILIEMSTGCAPIRYEPQQADTEGENAQQQPAEEAEIEHKQLPFVTVHEPYALSNSLVASHLPVVFVDIVGHGISIRFDESGNDQQQRPEEGVDADEQRQKKALG